MALNGRARILAVVFALLAAPGVAQVSVDRDSQRLDLDEQVRWQVDEGGPAPGADDRAWQVWGSSQRLNLGYRAESVWLRVPVQRAMDAPDRWWLEIGYASLDRVEVREASGQMQVVGDALPFHQRPLREATLLLPVQLPPGRSDLLLRVTTSGSLTMPLTLWQPEHWRSAERGRHAVMLVYYGMLLGLLGYNALLGLALRERLYGWYVLYGLALLAALLALSGYGNAWVWPGAPLLANIALPAGFSLAAAFGALFARDFLALPQHDRRLDRLMLGVFALSSAVALSPAIVGFRMGTLLMSANGLLFVVAVFVVAIAAAMRRRPGAFLFLTAWSSLLLGAGVLALRNFGLLPTNAFTSYGLQIGSALEMLLLSFALAARFIALRREHAEGQAALLAAREDALALAVQHERDLERRVSERTAELEFLNQRLQQNEAELRHLATHDPLTGVSNRAALVHDLDHSLARNRRTPEHLAVLLFDLDNFKPINDRLGHAAGDAVLKEVANRLRDGVRSGDMVARFGGDEFVVVLHGVAGAEAADLVAETLLRRLGAPFAVQGEPVVIEASVGIAILSDDVASRQELLRRADQAMYWAKASGRNRYVVWAADLR